MVVGNPNNIAFSIGRYCPHSTLRKVEIFLSGNVITNENNMAYVPIFTHALKRDIINLKKRRMKPGWFMNLGDTTDNFSLRVYFSNNRLIVKKFKNRRYKIVGVFPVESIIQTFLLAVKQLER